MKWKSYLPLTGAAAALIAFILLMAKACQEVYYADMIHVKAGELKMGCNDCQLRERPEHSVKLKGFWIDYDEVTNIQYVDFLNAALEKGWVTLIPVEDSGEVEYQRVEIDGQRVTNLNPASSWSHIKYENGVFAVLEGKEEFPVTVTWHGAQAYCASFNKRLPSEAEWEYAAKGGHLSHYSPGVTDYFLYSGSDNADQVAWHNNNAGISRHPVRELTPNELNIYDMSGNLREWVNDWYDPAYYSISPRVNPQGPDASVYLPELGINAGKVMRGGSWKENSYQYDEDIDIETSVDRNRVRVTKRDFGCPSSVSDRTGFRCAAEEMKLPVFHFIKPFNTLIKPESDTLVDWPTDENYPEELEE